MYKCEHCGTELEKMADYEDVHKCRKCRREYDEDYLAQDDEYQEETEE